VTDELRKWTPNLKLSLKAEICSKVWCRLVLAAHDSFTGGSLLPFHKRSVEENKDAIRKEKKRKIKENKEKKKKEARVELEKSIRNEIMKDMSAIQSIFEIPQENVLEQEVLEEEVLEINTHNANEKKKKNADRNVYDRMTLKARDPSRVSLRPFLKSRK